MPNSETFSIKPIRELIDRYKKDGMVIVDPFARNSDIGTITNDLDPETKAMYHKDATDFLCHLDDNIADMVLYDPPYSARQVSESYKRLGGAVDMQTTQSSYWARQKKEIARITKKGGVVITCAWNSGGIGAGLGFEQQEILLVAHGGWHNDTIVTVERKGEVEIDNEKYHLSGIEYVAKRYQDMFYAGRDIYYFKGIGGHGMTDLLRNAIDDLLDTINSKETYRSAEHRVYAQMNKLTEAGAMISLAIELLTSNIRHSYGEINFERYPRPVEVEGEDKH